MELKKIAIQILRWKLRFLAQLTIWRYRPGIIGVTGSVGKTSTKLAIAAVLGSERRVRASRGNLNNDLGVPLTILGDWREKDLKLISREQPEGERIFEKSFFWLKVICLGCFRVIFPQRSSYPEILVLEYGADRPGDIKNLLGIARPNIGVITAIGDVPVHVEFYKGPDEVAREKARLVEYLPAAGFAVLNCDDKTVMDLQDRTRAHVMTYGFGKGAELRISRFENRSDDNEPKGITFRLEYAGTAVPVKLEGMLGKSQAYAAGAAAALGLIFGMNLVKISEALKSYIPPPHRMQLLRGVKDTYIIDDAYNASPLSMEAALHALSSLPGRRKIAVLGDMLEIGEYTMKAHEEVGRKAGAFVDLLVTIGSRAKFIAEGAKKERMSKKNIKSFDTPEEAAKPVEGLIKKGDLILIKASRGIHLERVVEEIQGLEK